MTSPEEPRRSEPEPQEPVSNGAARSRAIWATGIRATTQLVGLVLVINEALIRETTRNSVMLIIAICVLGVQPIENVLLRTIDRLFGAGNGSSR